MRSPTGSTVATGCGEGAARVISDPSNMPRGAARNLELRAGDEARGRRAEKSDGAGHLVGLAQPPHRNMPAAGDLGEPLLACLRRVLARHEAPLPLPGIDQAQKHRVDAD